MLSSANTGGSFEATGYGYGPGIGEGYEQLVMIVSRASGAPVIAGAIRYAAQLVRNKVFEVAKAEFAAAKKAGLKKILDARKAAAKPAAAEEDVKEPPKEIVTAQIAGIEVMDLEDAVKALKIDGAEATAENIENGSYKVSRPFNVAVKKDLDNEAAKDFMSFIMSTEGQKVVEEAGYIPVSDVQAYAGTKPEGSVVVGGSSSVAPVMEKLVEAYKKVNPNANVELQSSDSTTGMTSAIEGSYDIGMASRELKDEEKEKLEGTVIATDGIAVIVNKANPTEEMTSDQVKSIYLGDVLTWDEIAE